MKIAKPGVLEEKEEKWTSDYVASKGTADEKKKEKWRHREIKNALRTETFGKCAYCESFVEDVSFPHVEHIIPKHAHPELAHRWYNLTTACSQCNTSKAAFYKVGEGVLNPYADDIDAQLSFLGTLIEWNLGAVRGEITVR